MAVGDTSFNELTVAELRAVAEIFAVDLDGKTKKVDIINEITAMGVDWKQYQDTLNPDERSDEEEAVVAPAPVEEEPEDDEDQVVVKMIRKNWSYEIRGYRFTQDHPYALVKESDADFLIEEDGGFRMASPKELKDFYLR